MRQTKDLPGRLVPEGTRVILIKAGASGVPGVVTEVRREAHLKTYVVLCDDGATVFASPCDLARADDAAQTPLGPRPEY